MPRIKYVDPNARITREQMVADYSMQIKESTSKAERESLLDDLAGLWYEIYLFGERGEEKRIAAKKFGNCQLVIRNSKYEQTRQMLRGEGLLEVITALKH